MTLLIALVGTAGLGATILVLVIMARLTHRWELVTRSKSFYQLFYVAAALLGVASLSRLLYTIYVVSYAGSAILADPRSWFYICLYHAPLAVAMTLSLGVTWRNWGWLLREQNG
jgi:hypothetical protein